MKAYRLAVVFIVAVFCAAAWTGVVQVRAGAAPGGVTASKALASDSTDVEATITALEREWAAAIVKRDTPALERLIADDFNGTSPTAHTFPKTMAIDELKTGLYKVDSMVLDEISVNVYGDVAVAFTSQQEKSEYAGKDTSGHYHFTDVWVRTGDRWQVVASHGSRFNEKH
jgi:ketosteroid isomerase-like protein